MDACARLAWRDLRRSLERIVRDLDAVLRAHVGGPVLGFEALPTTNGEPEVRLSCGDTRFRLSAAPLTEPEGAPLCAADELVVFLRAEHAPVAAVVIRVDAVNRRWIVPEEPYTEHRLDDRAALETLLFSILADARGDEPASPGVWRPDTSCRAAPLEGLQERASPGSSAGIMPRCTTCPPSHSRIAAHRG